MHARRYFAKALDAGDARAAIPLKAFQALYVVEEGVRNADDTARKRERELRSKPVYEELVRWCELHQPMEPPASLLGRAIGYLLNHRLALMRFLDDGVVPIDNGIVERLHRRPAVHVSLCTSSLSTWNRECVGVSQIATRATGALATAA